MGDVSELFRQGFQAMHKASILGQSVQDRKTILTDIRREKRSTLAFQNRNIDVNMSPIVTPQVERKRIIEKNNVQDNAVKPLKNKRLEMLAEWKKQKVKRELEKAKNVKPVFKVCHVKTSLKTDFEIANQFIKGKPISNNLSHRWGIQSDYQFKFKAPSLKNIMESKKDSSVIYDKEKTKKANSKENLVNRKLFVPKINQPEKSKNPVKTTKIVDNISKNAQTNSLCSTSLNKSKNPVKSTKIVDNISKNAQTNLSSSTSLNKSSGTTSKNVEPRYLLRTRNATNQNDQVNARPKTAEIVSSTKPVLTKSQSSKGISNKVLQAVHSKENKDPETNKKTDSKFSKSLEKCSTDKKMENKDLLSNNKKNNIAKKELKKSTNTLTTAGLKKTISKPQLNKKTQKSSLGTPKKCDSNYHSSDDEVIIKSESVRNTPIPVQKDESNSKINISGLNNDSITPKETRSKNNKEVVTSSNKKTNVEDIETKKSDNCFTSTPSVQSDEKTQFSKKSKRLSTVRKDSLTTPKKCDIDKHTSDEEVFVKSESVKNTSLPQTNQNDDTDSEIKSLGCIEEKITIKETELKQEEVFYISPHVTFARGKAAARKEFKIRMSSGGALPDTPEYSRSHKKSTTPKAGAAYFMQKLNEETGRIETLCLEWEECRSDPSLPAEAHDSIDVAIGQSRLLIAKKFEQFRGLILQCGQEKCEDAEGPVTCQDLHGFWDMIYMQVEDVDKRFANLCRLKENAWQELLPQKKVPVKKQGRGRPKKNAPSAASSKLRDAIKAARLKKNQEHVVEPAESEGTHEEKKEEKVFEGGYFEVRSPVQRQPPTCLLGSNLRRSTIMSEANKKRCSMSPGLAMMNISSAIKLGNGITPSKSILKNNGCRSSIKSNKSVVFRDEVNRSIVKIRLFDDDS